MSAEDKNERTRGRASAGTRLPDSVDKREPLQHRANRQQVTRRTVYALLLILTRRGGPYVCKGCTAEEQGVSDSGVVGA